MIGPSAVKGKIAVRLSPGNNGDGVKLQRCTDPGQLELHQEIPQVSTIALAIGAFGLAWFARLRHGQFPFWDGNQSKKAMSNIFVSTKSCEGWEVMKRLWKEMKRVHDVFLRATKGRGWHWPWPGSTESLQVYSDAMQEKIHGFARGDRAPRLQDAAKSWTIQTSVVGTDESRSTIPHFSWWDFINKNLVYGTWFSATCNW